MTENDLKYNQILEKIDKLLDPISLSNNSKQKQHEEKQWLKEYQAGLIDILEKSNKKLCSMLLDKNKPLNELRKIEEILTKNEEIIEKANLLNNILLKIYKENINER